MITNVEVEDWTVRFHSVSSPARNDLILLVSVIMHIHSILAE